MSYSVEERYAALAVAERGRLVDLADAILRSVGDVRMLATPGPATMLVELTESVRCQPFHLCEVVVSEASVSVAGCRGDGLVLGADTERAVAAAVCDAAAEAGLYREAVEHLVADTLAGLDEDRRRWAAQVATTRVELEVLG
jgi:alpha-D-ribose 1-methylphosphonate 5-triphosphate synthase subunit PhnG